MTMKKLLYLFILLLSTCGIASAQKTEVTISYGAYTQMDATDMHDGWGGVNTAWGALNAGVNFRVAKNIWIGPSYTFSSATVGHGAYHSNIAYHAIMLNGRYNYYRKGDLKLYAKVGLGVEISHLMPKHHDSYNKTYCAFQVTPVGASYNIGSSVDLFAELGFGAQGLFQAGVKFGF